MPNLSAFHEKKINVQNVAIPQIEQRKRPFTEWISRDEWDELVKFIDENGNIATISNLYLLSQVVEHPFSKPEVRFYDYRMTLQAYKQTEEFTRGIAIIAQLRQCIGTEVDEMASDLYDFYRQRTEFLHKAKHTDAHQSWYIELLKHSLIAFPEDTDALRSLISPEQLQTMNRPQLSYESTLFNMASFKVIHPSVIVPDETLTADIQGKIKWNLGKKAWAHFLNLATQLATVSAHDVELTRNGVVLKYSSGSEAQTELPPTQRSF